jgi:hypothetical protein
MFALLRDANMSPGLQLSAIRSLLSVSGIWPGGMIALLAQNIVR